MAEHQASSITASPKMLYKYIPKSNEKNQNTALGSGRIGEILSILDRRLVPKVYKELQTFLEGDEGGGVEIEQGA